MKSLFRVILMDLAFLSNFANASVVCSEQESIFQPSSILVCKNVSQNGTSSVIFRNIPPWEGNSGITIIDICSGEIEPGKANKSQCVRRACYQESQTLSLRIGPITYPIGAFMGFLKISIAKAEFEVHCQFIKDSM